MTISHYYKLRTLSYFNFLQNNKVKFAMLTTAGQAEIVRAAQRDENFQNQLNENVSEILQSLCGIPFWIKYKNVAKMISNLLYHGITTMCNIQTLGEEYTGMLQVDSSIMSLPNKYIQSLMILFNILGEKIMMESLKKLEKKIRDLPKTHPLQPSARLKLIRILNSLKLSLPFIEKFHKALFYINGHYYEISKRICGIQYVLVRYWLKDRSSLPAFKLLGIFSTMELVLSTIFCIPNYKNLNLKNEALSKTLKESDDNANKCCLCLNVMQYTSVISCGHLFCWSCIISWLQEQPKCPLCRQECQPSRVVYLQN